MHNLIAERCEQAATIVTSNLDFPEWDQAFPSNRLLASASLDRLRHNAYCMVLDGASYRAPRTTAGASNPPPQKRQNNPISQPLGSPVQQPETGSITAIRDIRRLNASLMRQHP